MILVELPKAAIRRVAVTPPGRRQMRPGGATAYMTAFGISHFKLAGAGEADGDFGPRCPQGADHEPKACHELLKCEAKNAREPLCGSLDISLAGRAGWRDWLGDWLLLPN